MTRLILVRHGETAWNAAGRLQGHADVPLSPMGQQQADAVARFLASDTVHSVYSSDLQRAVRRLRPSLPRGVYRCGWTRVCASWPSGNGKV